VTIHESGPVERAVRAELRGLSVSVRDVADAALAVSLAAQVDRSRGAVGAAQAAKQVHDIMTAVRARAAELRPQRSQVDELRAKRSARAAEG
jgi:hypothetical protein